MNVDLYGFCMGFCMAVYMDVQTPPPLDLKTRLISSYGIYVASSRNIGNTLYEKTVNVLSLKCASL
jgi:hypothetical protein